ncbi:MAG: hypothetical protein ACPGSB_09285 [Opitutales bacterium]
MKAILPIIICSAITGALGYYFGHITLPANSGDASSEQAASAPAPQTATYTEPAPTTPRSTPDPIAPAPVISAPVAPVVNAEPVSTPAATTADFATRAAQTTHTLTDKEGKSIEVTIMEVLENEVKIRMSNGMVTTVQFSLLSDEDVAFCNYLREEAKKNEVIKPDNSDGFDWDEYFNS